jgi:hypothetical protein
MGWKDYEPDYAYLFVSPKTLASLRSANLVDSDRVEEGMISFETIFGGKFRLVVTRASQGLTSAERTSLNAGAGVDLVGTETSFIVLPNSLAFNPINTPDPIEIQRNASAYKGGGTTDVWYRWGYVVHPRGYTWEASEDKFAADADYMGVSVDDSTWTTLAAATVGANSRAAFQRKASSALSLGILPIFHS